MLHVKITDANGCTQNNTPWGVNVTHEITKPGNTLCSDEVFHGYPDAYTAVFFNPIHGNYAPATMRLWQAEGEPVANDGTKLGFKKQTTLREIPIPAMTTKQRVTIAILCAKAVYKERSFTRWADRWLKNIDRTYLAAYYAADAAYAADVTKIINEVMKNE
jgi:hypothetical protein